MRVLIYFPLSTPTLAFSNGNYYPTNKTATPSPNLFYQAGWLNRIVADTIMTVAASHQKQTGFITQYNLFNHIEFLVISFGFRIGMISPYETCLN